MYWSDLIKGKRWRVHYRLYLQGNRSDNLKLIGTEKQLRAAFNWPSMADTSGIKSN